MLFYTRRLLLPVSASLQISLPQWDTLPHSSSSLRLYWNRVKGGEGTMERIIVELAWVVGMPAGMWKIEAEVSLHIIATWLCKDEVMLNCKRKA